MGSIIKKYEDIKCVGGIYNIYYYTHLGDHYCNANKTKYARLIANAAKKEMDKLKRKKK